MDFSSLFEEGKSSLQQCINSTFCQGGTEKSVTKISKTSERFQAIFCLVLCVVTVLKFHFCYLMVVQSLKLESPNCTYLSQPFCYNFTNNYLIWRSQQGKSLRQSHLWVLQRKLQWNNKMFESCQKFLHLTYLNIFKILPLMDFF